MAEDMGPGRSWTQDHAGGSGGDREANQPCFVGTLGWEAHVPTSMATISLEPLEAIAQAMGHCKILGLEALLSSKLHVLLCHAVLVLFGAFVSRS